MVDDQRCLFKQKRLNTRLLEAVCSKNLEKVKCLLSSGANPDTRCRLNYMSACHLAAYYGLSSILEELLRKDADLGVRDIRGIQPHHLAAYNYRDDGSLECLKIMLNKQDNLLESPVREPDERETKVQDVAMDSYDHNHKELTNLVREHIKDGSTALYIAAKNGHLEVVRELIERKAIVKNETVAIAQEKNHGEIVILLYMARSLRPSMKPLQLAVLQGNVKEVAEILKCLKEDEELPPTTLHLAVQNNLKNKRNMDDYNIILQMLLDKSTTDIDSKDENEKTPLHLAIEGNWMDDMDLLLEKGAKVGIQCKDGETVLHTVARTNNCDLLQHLLENATTDIFRIKDKAGYTALYRAIKTGSAGCVEALLETGEVEFHLEILDSAGSKIRKSTIIHEGIESNRNNWMTLQKIVEYVLKKNHCIINERNSDGLTAVDLAAKEGQARCLEVLFQYDLVQVKPRKEDLQDTPLHHASRNGFYKCIEILLDKCEELINMPDSKDITPLIHAARGGHSKCVEILLRRGANLAAMDPSLNRSAIDIIMSNVSNPVEMIEDLLGNSIRPIRDDGQLTEVTVVSSNTPKAQLDPNKMSGKEQHPLLQNSNNNNNYKDRSETEYKLHGVKLDYKCLVAGPRQLAVIEAVNNCKYERLQQKFFLHPLVKTFLSCKWKTLNKIFYSLLIVYILHIISITGLALSVYVYQNSLPTYVHYIWSSILLMTIVPVIIVEIVSILLSAKIYSAFETYIKFLAILSTIFLTIMPEWWGRYLTSVTVLLACMELLLFYAMSPKGGFYILLLFKVAKNVFQVFSSFLILILGFAASFFILFSGKQPFPDPLNTLGSVIAMISELNYSETFENDAAESLQFKVLGRLLFLGFYVLVVIVMMNLIVGFSVNVVTEHEGRSRHLAMQGSFLSLVDKLNCNSVTNKFLLWLRDLMESQMKKIFRPDSQHLYIFPNQPTKSDPLDKELICEVMEIVNNSNRNYRPETILQKMKSMKDTLDNVLENIHKRSD